MSETIEPNWFAYASPPPPKVLWARDGWIVTSAGLAESSGANGIDRDNLADIREDGLLSVPIYTAVAPGLDLDAFLRAFRAALRLHRLRVDPAALQASEAAALKVRLQSERDAGTWKAHRRGRRSVVALAQAAE